MWHNCATKRLIFCQFYNINKLVTILSESSTYLTAAFTIPARYSHSVYEPSDTADPQLHLDPHIISEVLFIVSDSSVPVPAAQGESPSDSQYVLPAEAFLNEVGSLDSEACQKQRQVQQDLPCRHILVDKINTVP